MKTKDDLSSERRDFLTKSVPVCAAACLATSNLFAMSSGFSSSQQQKEVHKFDKKRPGPDMTYNRYQIARQLNFVRFAKFLEQEIGKEKMLDLVKKHATERLLSAAKRDLERLGNSDFKSYISIFRNPNMLATLTMDIIEDTDTVFEIKVKECLSANTFLRLDAGDIGYARVCWGDYVWAEGFNPMIKLIRDKTLMQGDDFCNHRYVWTG